VRVASWHAYVQARDGARPAGGARWRLVGQPALALAAHPDAHEDEHGDQGNRENKGRENQNDNHVPALSRRALRYVFIEPGDRLMQAVRGLTTPVRALDEQLAALG